MGGLKVLAMTLGASSWSCTVGVTLASSAGTKTSWGSIWGFKAVVGEGGRREEEGVRGRIEEEHGSNMEATEGGSGRGGEGRGGERRRTIDNG